jgi:hypothetical protein
VGSRDLMRRLAVIGAVFAVVPAAHGQPPTRARLTWSAAAGGAMQALGDADGAGPSLAGTVGIPVGRQVSVEAVTDAVLQLEDGPDDGTLTRLHLFAGVGVRLELGRFHLALATGIDKVWMWGGLGANPHARGLPALHGAVGYDVLLRRHLRVGVELGAAGAPLFEVGDPPDFPDDRAALFLRLRVVGRR